IVSVEPPTATIEPAIVGGDSFFELTVAPGTEVFVVGYQGEDTIWFLTDGTVWENQNSPSTYLNADRLGGGGIPDTATKDAEPDWRQVAADGNYSCHDHRAHWMQQARPFGLGPGDQILESVIPLVVDGTDVEITVISTWQPAPSPLPAIAGVALGAGLGVAAWFLHRARRSGAALALTLLVSVLALIVGAWQFLSLPPETGPKLVWWVLPMVAVFSAAFGTLAAKRSMTFVADAAMLLVGVELAIWGFVKRDGLSAAIIPTDAPAALDRFVTAMALSSGVLFAGLALWWLFRPSHGAGSNVTSATSTPSAIPGS
ncbi:MAG TPA: hypothetical protein VES40_15345, partial [Ilumatobacteraceae bacterium]|nr:hypothetical protein [Ilumatobacteraceae bacterium]